VTRYIPIMSDVQLVVAQHFGLTVDDLLGQERYKTTAYARHIVSFLAREQLGMSYPEIARVSRRDHTSVLSGVRKIWRLVADGDRATTNHLHALLARLDVGSMRRAA